MNTVAQTTQSEAIAMLHAIGLWHNPA